MATLKILNPDGTQGITIAPNGSVGFNGYPDTAWLISVDGVGVIDWSGRFPVICCRAAAVVPVQGTVVLSPGASTVIAVSGGTTPPIVSTGNLDVAELGTGSFSLKNYKGPARSVDYCYW